MKVTEDGTTHFELVTGRTYTFFAGGYFGGGTVYLALTDASITGSLPMPGYPTITSTTAFRFVASAPFLVVYLENATAPSFIVDCVLCPC